MDKGSVQQLVPVCLLVFLLKLENQLFHNLIQLRVAGDILPIFPKIQVPQAFLPEQLPCLIGTVQSSLLEVEARFPRHMQHSTLNISICFCTGGMLDTAVQQIAGTGITGIDIQRNLLLFRHLHRLILPIPVQQNANAFCKGIPGHIPFQKHFQGSRALFRWEQLIIHVNCGESLLGHRLLFPQILQIGHDCLRIFPRSQSLKCRLQLGTGQNCLRMQPAIIVRKQIGRRILEVRIKNTVKMGILGNIDFFRVNNLVFLVFPMVQIIPGNGRLRNRRRSCAHHHLSVNRVGIAGKADKIHRR